MRRDGFHLLYYKDAVWKRTGAGFELIRMKEKKITTSRSVAPATLLCFSQILMYWRGNDERKKISPKTQMIEHFSEFSCKRGKMGCFFPY